VLSHLKKFLENIPDSMYSVIVKPVFDFFVAVVLLLLFSPVFLLIIIALGIINRGSVFFIQPRPGKNEKIFNLIKFKTMTEEKDEKGELLPDALRITRFGEFLRKTSLDELPQLLNVIKGELSLVGPRPLLVEYLELYNERQRQRHTVKPGITGWAQVNGRNSIRWEEKFEMDVWYVEGCSFILDIKILMLTISKVFKRENINMDVNQTMSKFQG